ncbi:MAG: helix-turn-helix domain-containing protein [Alkaliphilus sp.]
MEIMSIGKKIKTLRKKVGVRQDQLTDDLITRSLISMIESGKRNLNKKTATIIAKRLSIYYENLGEIITADYLLESEEIQASKAIDSNIKELYSMINDRKRFQEQRLKDVIECAKKLAVKWKLPDKMSEIYFFEGEYDYEFAKYSEAIMNFFSALEYQIESKKYDFVAEIFIKLSRCYCELGQLQEAIEYNQKASSITFENNTNNLDAIEIESVLNNIVYYTEINKLDVVLFNISRIKKTSNMPQDALFKVLTHEGNTYRELKNFEKSQKIFDKLVSKESKIKTELLAEMHLERAKLFADIGDIEKSLQACNDALITCEKIESVELIRILHKIAKQYFEFEKYELALTILTKAKQNAEEKCKTNDVYNILIYRAEVYKRISEFQNAELDLIYAEELVKKENLKIDFYKLYALYSELYFEMNNLEKCRAYLEKIRKH